MIGLIQRVSDAKVVVDGHTVAEIGLGLLTAIKEFDFFYHNLVRNDRDDEAEDKFQLMQLGLPRLIAAVLGSVPRFRHPTVTFRSDEALIFKTHDTDSSVAHCVPHGAFDDPACPPDAQPRASIEMRGISYWFD